MPTTLIAGDLEPDLQLQLLEPHATVPGARQPIDLTGATALTLRWLPPGEGTTVITRALTVVDAAGGAVRLTWQAGDTAVAGIHRAHVVITWPVGAGEEQTVPSDGEAYTWMINPRLGG